MSRTSLLGIILVTSLAVGACGQQAASPPPDPPLKPVASMKQLMAALTEPSNVVFNVGIDPPTEETWIAAQTNAVLVAEIGNLLLLGDRLKDRGDWVTFSQAMTEAAIAALRAAESKNVDAMTMAGEKLLGTCSQCHEKYME
jgi:cytochrome c556